MSEQDKSGGGAGGSSVVLVEPSATSRHKQPLRSTDITEETIELHHKHSKAPAVPSAVAEEIKDNDITNVDVNERRESECAMTSEKHKHAVKKLSNTKRRASSPEAITMTPIELETKVASSSKLSVGSVTPPTQPIPAQISESSISEVIPEKSASIKKEEDDSITEDITEMRTPEIVSEWDNVDLHKEKKERKKEINFNLKTSTPAELEISSSQSCKSEKVCWNRDEYLKCTKIKELRSLSSVILESKASVGPCFYPKSPLGKPSGIAISIPKKSIKSISEMYSERQSVINISIGKKTHINKTKSTIMTESYIDKEQGNGVVPNITFIGALRQKILNVGNKIKSSLK